MYMLTYMHTQTRNEKYGDLHYISHVITSFLYANCVKEHGHLINQAHAYFSIDNENHIFEMVMISQFKTNYIIVLKCM